MSGALRISRDSYAGRTMRQRADDPPKPFRVVVKRPTDGVALTFAPSPSKAAADKTCAALRRWGMDAEVRKA